MTKKKKAPDFEAALAELEALVERMEHGEITLEESLDDFARGVELTRTCQAALQQAEQRVQILMSKDASAEPEPFAPQDNTP